MKEVIKMKIEEIDRKEFCNQIMEFIPNESATFLVKALHIARSEYPPTWNAKDILRKINNTGIIKKVD